MKIIERLDQSKKKWLITGVAGFIGSNLLEFLLLHNQDVVGVDNFSTGSKENLDDVKNVIGIKKWQNFKFIEMDLIDYDGCQTITKNIDYVLHQAALGSVPRSIKDPINSNRSNVSGFLNILNASRINSVKKFIYASSSSVYGDHPNLPKQENLIGNQLSPYALTKYINEQYADIFYKTYSFKAIGMRYFNVFGKRQNPNGAYAAVIPRWINSLINNETINIFGDGLTSRDFCYIENAVQANILLALNDEITENEVFNVSVGGNTTLNELLELIRHYLKLNKVASKSNIEYKDFRDGDVRHSQADISKIQRYGYNPEYDVKHGIEKTINWYIEKNDKKGF